MWKARQSRPFTPHAMQRKAPVLTFTRRLGCVSPWNGQRASLHSPRPLRTVPCVL
ncbi:MAG: hypothetical protein WCS71_06840 [Sphaerochaetaceae bacterium]